MPVFFFGGGGGQPGHRNNVAAAAAMFWAPQFGFIPFPLLPREGGQRKEGRDAASDADPIRAYVYVRLVLSLPAIAFDAR